MQQAIPAHEYSADERADRARGATIAVLALAVIGLAIPAGFLVLILL